MVATSISYTTLKMLLNIVNTGKIDNFSVAKITGQEYKIIDYCLLGNLIIARLKKDFVTFINSK